MRVNTRVRTLWLPGLVLFLASMGLLGLLIWAGVRPLTFFLNWHHPLQFYVPWLVVLPVLGAVGAYWSRRAGGGTRTRLLASVFPVLPLAGMAVVGLLADLIVDVGGGRHSVWHTLCGAGYLVVCWLLVPGAALLLGALPFLERREPTGGLSL